jgi:hypothetical protein
MVLRVTIRNISTPITKVLHPAHGKGQAIHLKHVAVLPDKLSEDTFQELHKKYVTVNSASKSLKNKDHPILFLVV